MATFYIPAAMRKLTGGATTASVPGETLAEALDALDAAHPGLKERMLQDGKLRPGMAVFVDGEIASAGLRARLKPDSEVHFAPAIAGG
jgi:sulfur-carrier protein